MDLHTVQRSIVHCTAGLDVFRLELFQVQADKLGTGVSPAVDVIVDLVFGV